MLDPREVRESWVVCGENYNHSQHKISIFTLYFHLIYKGF